MAKDVLGTSNFFSSKYVKIVLIVLAITIVISIIGYIIKAQKLASAAAGEIIGGVQIEQQTGIPPPRQNVCKQVSIDCENAVTRVPFIGTKIWCTDDDVVNALNRLNTANEAVLACTFYKQLTGESLKALVEGGLFVEQNRKRITLRTSLT